MRLSGNQQVSWPLDGKSRHEREEKPRLTDTTRRNLKADGLVWRSAQPIVTPYVVEVDKTG